MCLPFLLALVACGSDTPPRPPTYTLDTLPNGAISVTNTGDPAWTEDEAWSAFEELRLGTVEGGGPEQFGVILALEVDPTGRIFVADAQAGEIRIFEPDGTFSHAFGRSGQGPEEFGVLYGLRLDAQGRLWVRDVRNMRFAAFTPEGEHLLTHPIRFRSALPNWQGRFDAEGRLVGWDVFRPFRRVDGSTETVWDPRARRRDEVAFIPIRVTLGEQSQDSLPPVYHILDYIAGTKIPKPYSGLPTMHVDADLRIWFGSSDEYRIIQRDLMGDTALVFSLPVTPEAVTEDEKLALAESFPLQRRLPLDQIRDAKPVLKRITAGDDGYVYVFPHLADAAEGTVVDVFTKEGIYQGRISLPARLTLLNRPVLVRAGRLYGIVLDDLDVEHVVRMRLGPAPPLPDPPPHRLIQ